ncbi:TetR/AcrR family transcriptional regulator [Nonomuraea sp. NPDC000554]|uniref:TetR/AcrR family transcriptional regulator n=1 Tax=Nonomuraea sp. NPDC000554 TaxID=3154259 RepID=UPI003319BF30
MAEGLRERKKRETRQRIADIAMGLFMTRGFDNVTVAEVARAADVSVNTVFNYFGTKEDLFADRQHLAVDLPKQVVQGREPGESAVRAFRRDFLDALDTRDWRYGFNEGSDLFAKMVGESPSLVARMREMHGEREQALAEALAEEVDSDPDDLAPHVVAALILNTTRVMTAYAVRRKLAGESWDEIAPDIRAQAERAFDLLESGIGGYCARPLAVDDGAQDARPSGEEEEQRVDAAPEDH